MSTKENLTKKQHYVPRFYLRRFSADGKSLCVYDRERSVYRKQSISDTCESNFLYDTRAEGLVNGLIRPNSTESALSELESEFTKTLDSVLAEGIPIEERARLFSLNRESLEAFCSNLIFRSPETMQAFTDLDEARIALKECDDPFDEGDFEFLDYVFGSADYVIEESLKQVLAAGSIDGESVGPQHEFREMLSRMTLVIALDPNGGFLTSSRPFFSKFENDDEARFVYVPLSPCVAVAFTKGAPKVVASEISASDVLASNKLILSPDRGDWKYGIALRKETLEAALAK